MKGRRLSDADYLPRAEAQPGDYWKNPEDGFWVLIAPNGISGRLNPKIHTITQHDDGTITVTPSIVFDKSNPQPQDHLSYWHGHLERGVWRQV
jgi:hypothetical protein